MGRGDGTPVILGARRSRVVAGIWALVGLGFLAAGVILWVDARRVSFELPAALLAFVLAAAWWRQRAVLDRHGINTVHAFRERRLLWAGIDHVVVDRPGWFRPALVLYPKGGRARTTVPASAGLNRRQRNRLLELLTDLSHQHGFLLLTHADAASDEGLPAPAGAYRTVPSGARRDADGAAMFGDATVDDEFEVDDREVDDPGSAEPDRTEWESAQPDRTEPDRTEPDGTESDRTEPDGTESGRIESGVRDAERDQADVPDTIHDHDEDEAGPGGEPVTGTRPSRSPSDEASDPPGDATTASDPAWLALIEPPADERAGRDDSARY